MQRQLEEQHLCLRRQWIVRVCWAFPIGCMHDDDNLCFHQLQGARCIPKDADPVTTVMSAAGQQSIAKYRLAHVAVRTWHIDHIG